MKGPATQSQKPPPIVTRLDIIKSANVVSSTKVTLSSWAAFNIYLQLLISSNKIMKGAETIKVTGLVGAPIILVLSCVMAWYLAKVSIMAQNNCSNLKGKFITADHGEVFYYLYLNKVGWTKKQATVLKIVVDILMGIDIFEYATTNYMVSMQNIAEVLRKYNIITYDIVIIAILSAPSFLTFLLPNLKTLSLLIVLANIFTFTEVIRLCVNGVIDFNPDNLKRLYYIPKPPLFTKELLYAISHFQTGGVILYTIRNEMDPSENLKGNTSYIMYALILYYCIIHVTGMILRLAYFNEMPKRPIELFGVENSVGQLGYIFNSLFVLVEFFVLNYYIFHSVFPLIYPFIKRTKYVICFESLTKFVVLILYGVHALYTQRGDVTNILRFLCFHPLRSLLLPAMLVYGTYHEHLGCLKKTFICFLLLVALSGFVCALYQIITNNSYTPWLIYA